MLQPVSDDGDKLSPAQASATIKQALHLLQSYATFGDAEIDAAVLEAEQALRRARRLQGKSRQNRRTR